MSVSDGRLRGGSMFSGSGMLDVAVHRVLGVEPTWFMENDPAASKVLAHHWPDVPNHGDVTAVDWAAVKPVDVLTAGFPCTDISLAGKRLGLRPGSRSGLWSHVAYAISQLRPRLVVIENVRGILSGDAHCDLEPCPWCLGDSEGRPLRALGSLCGDLAGLGYDTQWCGLRASDVGAPHDRFGVIIIARPVADTAGIGSIWCREARRRGNGSANRGEPPVPGGHSRRSWVSVDGIDYGPAIYRWETILGRPVPDPTQAGTRGGQQLSGAFDEWMMGWPQGWVTEVLGLSRSAQVKICGNGVVPQQVVAALSWLFDGRGLDDEITQSETGDDPCETPRSTAPAHSV